MVNKFYKIVPISEVDWYANTTETDEFSSQISEVVDDGIYVALEEGEDLTIDSYQLEQLEEAVKND